MSASIASFAPASFLYARTCRRSRRDAGYCPDLVLSFRGFDGSLDRLYPIRKGCGRKTSHGKCDQGHDPAFDL